jgi:hypothetical protein
MKKWSKKTPGVSYEVSIREETHEPLSHAEVRGSSLLGFRKIVADEIKSGQECLSLIPPE